MPTLYYTQGLPGSGKTRWAKEQQPGVIRLNRDELRRMMHGGYYKELEPTITTAQFVLATRILQYGNDVVFDDTNLNPRTVADIRQLAMNLMEYGVRLERKSFLWVPLEQCIANDALRTGVEHVGEEAIRRMYNKYRDLFPYGEDSRGIVQS